MPVSRLDTVYRKMLLTKFFTKGWGSPEHLMRLFAFRRLVSNRDTCYHLVSKDHPISIVNEETWKDCRVIEGKFRSPLALHLPDIVPDEVQDAYFQMILPLKWKSKHKSICIHLAGTGDHGRFMSFVLIYLFNAKFCSRSSLHHVSDIFVMGGCLILECMVLLHWCEKLGYGPLGVTGLSMGGHMASLAATNWPKPLVLVPCLSWSSASSVFTEGVMSDSIDWNLLQEQYSANSLFYDKLANLVTIVDKSIINQTCMYNKSQFTPGIEKRNEPSKYDMGQDLVNDQAFREDNENILKKVNEMKQSGLLSPKITNAIKLPTFIQRNFDTLAKLPLMKKPKDAVHFMRGIMDECTHLRNFSIPLETSLIIGVIAQSDGYVPREGCSSLEDIWPGATIRCLDAGHVSAYVLYRKFFRKCIVEAFERSQAML